MGRYRNPKNTPKEVWLFDNGFLVPNPHNLPKVLVGLMSLKTAVNQVIDAMADCGEEEPPEEKGDNAFFNHYVIVELINNGKFRAAAVYTSREEALANCENLESDHRQKLWFIVDREKALAEVRPFPSN